MQVTISGRHFTVTKELKTYIQKKVLRFEKYSKRIIDVHITLSVEKYRQCAEVSVFGKRLKVTEVSETTDMHAAIDDVCSRIEKTLSRYKDKIKGHRKKSNKPQPINNEGEIL